MFSKLSFICWYSVIWCTYSLQVHLQETWEKLEPFLERQIFRHHPHGPSDYRLLRGQPYREERSVEGMEDLSSNTLSISLPVKGTDLQFILNKVNIADPGLTLKVSAEGDEDMETELQVPLDCFYSGGDEGQWVVMSTCTGMNGVVSHDGMAYQVEQITSGDERLMRHRRHISEPLFVIYPIRSQVSEKLDLFPVGGPSPISSLQPSLRQPSSMYNSLNIPMEEESGGEGEGGEGEGEGVGGHRVKRRISKGPYTVELAVFVDRALYSYIKQRYPNSDQNTKTVEIVMTLVNAVHRLYSDTSLGSEKVKMMVKKVEVLPSDEPSYAKGNIYKYLKNFCQWQEDENPVGMAGHWDHALLLSGHDLWNDSPDQNSTVGLAYVGGMCSSSYSCTINEATTFAAAYIIAHEMGHNFDMKHDGSLEAFTCNANEYIMSPVMASGATKWSSCSKSALSSFLKVRGSCLMESATSTTRVGEKTHDGQAPGKRFDADAQCHYMYGKDWNFFESVEHPFNNVCREIWCRKGRLLKTPTASALEGTPCGKNKVCKRSKCTKEAKIKEKKTNDKMIVKKKGKKKVDKKKEKKVNKKKKKNKDTKKNDKKKKKSEKEKIKETETKAATKGKPMKGKKKKKNNDKDKKSADKKDSKKKDKAKDKTKKAKKDKKDKKDKKKDKKDKNVVNANKKNKLSSSDGEKTSVKTKIKINNKKKKPKKIRRAETPTHFVIKERKNYVKGKGWKIKIIRIKKTKSMLGVLGKKDKKEKKKKRKRRRKCKKEFKAKCKKRQERIKNKSNRSKKTRMINPFTEKPQRGSKDNLIIRVPKFTTTTKASIPVLSCEPEKVKRVEGKGWWVKVPVECASYITG